MKEEEEGNVITKYESLPLERRLKIVAFHVGNE